MTGTAMNDSELQKKLTELTRDVDKISLQQKLDEFDVKQIVSCVNQCILRGKSDPIPILKCIFNGSQGKSELCENRCYQIYTSLINLLQKNEINAKSAFSLLGVLLAEVDHLQAQCLVDLAQYFVDMVKNGTVCEGKALDLFPKILSIIDQCNEVPKGTGIVKGQEYKASIVNSMCSCRWNPSITLLMATLFHDIPLTLDQLKFVVEKIVRMIKDIGLSDQPALVFQLLRLSSKGHKKIIIEGITSHYTSLDDANRGRSVMIDSEDLMSDVTCLTTLRQVEGTVILHILQAVKQDQELGREVIKYFKVLQSSDAHKVISPFNLSLLLAVLQLQHFQDQILDFVKVTVLKCIKEEARQKQSFWVRECFPSSTTSKDLLFEAVENSTYGWDHVIQGLLQLGFYFMDSYGPKLVFGQLPEAPPLSESHMTPHQLACKITRYLLLKMFKLHEVIRSDIVQLIFLTIINKSMMPVSHYMVDDDYRLFSSRFTREGKRRRPDASPPLLTNRILVQLWVIMLLGGHGRNKIVDWIGDLFPDNPILTATNDRLRSTVLIIYTRALQLVEGPREVILRFLDLLSDIVHSAPQLLLQSSGKVQDAITELFVLPPSTGQALLMAIQPILKVSPFLKDSVLLVLRKAMFSRRLEARKIGALGFLIILKNFRVVGSLPSSQISQPFALSQIRVEVHGKYNAASNEALCLEILGNLRRCFTQQADIRLAIYQDLYEVLHRNSELKTPVLDMLLSQLKKFYDRNGEDCPPLCLDQCILDQGGQVFLSEPLAHLVGCVQQCVRKAADINAQSIRDDDDDDDDDGGGRESQWSFQQLQTILDDLIKRMIDTSMEVFELDKSADFSLTSSIGVKNNIFAIILTGIYEVLMEYCFETKNLSEASCKQITELFSNYSKITLLVKDKTSGPSGKKVKPLNAKAPTSLLSVQTVVSLLRLFVENNPTTDSKGKDVLTDCKDLFSHLVTAACQKLEQVHAKGYADGEERNKAKVVKDCWILGRLLYLHYIANQAGSDNLGERERNVVSQCLFGLSLGIKIAIQSGDQAVFWCLSHLEKEVDEEKDLIRNRQVVEKVHQHIKKMQRLASTIVNEDHENQNWKEFSTLLTIIGQLSTFLHSSSEEFQQSYNWLLKVCTECSVEDASAAKSLIALLLTLSKDTKYLPQILRNLSQDIHSQFGDIEKDCAIDDKTHYTVTKSNCCPPSSTLMLVLNHLDTDVDDVEWVIKRHQAQKFMSKSANADDSMGATQEEQMDRSLCTRLGILVNGYIELCHSAIISKSCSQALLKSLTKLFNTLASLTKHYLSLYTNKAGSMCSRFEKLICLVGRQLTQPTYCMITYVQMLEVEDISNVPDKDKKGKKKGANSGANSEMAKAMKQMKNISSLVFAIEQLEKFVIQLSKKSKVSLMDNFKHSTSRDFRINAEKVNEVVEEEVSSDNESDKEDGGDEGNETGDNQDAEGTVDSNTEDENDRLHETEGNLVSQDKEKSKAPPTKKAKLSFEKK